MQELCGWDNLRALKNAASPGKNPSEGKRSPGKQQGHFVTSGVYMGTAVRSLAALLCFSSSVWVTAQNVTAQDRPTPAIMPLDQIHEGMKGTALTVFQGVKPESMDVEVLGVMHNVNGPKGDIILIRLHGTKPEYTGVVAGMSGSPVYFDGKLAGALAFRIGEFSKEPIAGVTPIEEMMEINELDRRPPPSRAKLPGAGRQDACHSRSSGSTQTASPTEKSNITTKKN